MRTITKIVLTGGPCAGKSEGLIRVKEYFEKIGYTVFCIDETVTRLKHEGFTDYILGLEVAKHPDKIKFPPFLTILEDITGNEKYKNSTIARALAEKRHNN